MAQTDTATHITRINDNYQTIETPYGLFLHNRHDYGYPWSNGDPNFTEIEFLLQFVHGTVIDVGANIGTHTIPYARAADVVYAFEPQKDCYNLLCANLVLNGIRNVETINAGLGAITCAMPMLSYDPGGVHSAAGLMVGVDESNVVFVDTTETNTLGSYSVGVAPLDMFGIKDVSFIKIDVEGFELEVLKGAVETIKESRPIIFVEVHAGVPVEDVCSILDTYRGNRAFTQMILNPWAPHKLMRAQESWLFLPCEIVGYFKS